MAQTTATLLCEDHFVNAQTIGCSFTDQSNLLKKENGYLALGVDFFSTGFLEINDIYLNVSQNLSIFDSLRLNIDVSAIGYYSQSQGEIITANQPYSLPIVYYYLDTLYTGDLFFDITDNISFYGRTTGSLSDNLFHITTTFSELSGTSLLFARTYKGAILRTTSWGYNGNYDEYMVKSTFCSTKPDPQDCFSKASMPMFGQSSIRFYKFKATGLKTTPLGIEGITPLHRERNVVSAYNVMGQIIDQPSLYVGVLIYRYEDGSTEKVMQSNLR